VENIRNQAERILPALTAALGDRYTVEVVDASGQTGSGSLPTETIPGVAFAIGTLNKSDDVTRGLSAAFRKLPIPVIGYVHKGRLMLDLRCLDNEAAFLSQLEFLQT
jgi:L-seryl-tRNA(Ser) seleniumtransferase